MVTQHMPLAKSGGHCHKIAAATEKLLAQTSFVSRLTKLPRKIYCSDKLDISTPSLVATLFDSVQ
jgi:hypothetical protein